MTTRWRRRNDVIVFILQENRGDRFGIVLTDSVAKRRSRSRPGRLCFLFRRHGSLSQQQTTDDDSQEPVSPTGALLLAAFKLRTARSSWWRKISSRKEFLVCQTSQRHMFSEITRVGYFLDQSERVEIRLAMWRSTRCVDGIHTIEPVSFSVATRADGLNRAPWHAVVEKPVHCWRPRRRPHPFSSGKGAAERRGGLRRYHRP